VDPTEAYGGRATFKGAGLIERKSYNKAKLLPTTMDKEFEEALLGSYAPMNTNSGDEDPEEEEARWLELMAEVEEGERFVAAEPSASFDLERMRRNLELMNNFTEAEKKMMGEVEMWARLISTIKAQISPTGCDQVATILAWEQFQINKSGFGTAETDQIIVIGPDDNGKPKNGKKKNNKATNANVESHYSHLIRPPSPNRRSSPNTPRLLPKSKQGAKPADTTQRNPTSKRAKVPAKVSTNIPAKTPVNAPKSAPGAGNPASPAAATGGLIPSAKPRRSFPVTPESPKGGAVAAKEPSPKEPRQSKIFARESVDEPKIFQPGARKKNRNFNSNKKEKPENLLNSVGRRIMRQMLDEEPKTAYQRTKEKFLRKVKSHDQFYEDELRKRPDWEKIIHDAEVD